ncbi:MAG: hypothetical protein ACRD3O_04840, partial [Terriglobia bacterium]
FGVERVGKDFFILPATSPSLTSSFEKMLLYQDSLPAGKPRSNLSWESTGWVNLSERRVGQLW